MFIVWGKKIKKQRMGFVADYCVPCQDLRAFEMKRIEQLRTDALGGSRT